MHVDTPYLRVLRSVLTLAGAPHVDANTGMASGGHTQPSHLHSAQLQQLPSPLPSFPSHGAYSNHSPRAADPRQMQHQHQQPLPSPGQMQQYPGMGLLGGMGHHMPMGLPPRPMSYIDAQVASALAAPSSSHMEHDDDDDTDSEDNKGRRGPRSK